MASYKKKLLPSGTYHITVRDSRYHNGGLRITFTIDRGEHSYRNIIEQFPLTEFGIERLNNLFAGINFVVFDDFQSKLFVDQFTSNKLRAKAKVDRHIVDDVMKNRVIELQPPDKPEDYNVLKPKSDEFYNKRNKGKELPIKKES